MALVASSHTDYVGLVCWGFDMFICDGDFVYAAQSIKNYFLPKK